MILNKLIFLVPIIISAIILVIPLAIYSDNFIMTVKTDSMTPTLIPGDILLVDKVSINQVKVDDIIAFELHAQGIETIAHRVIEIAKVDGVMGIDTAGDHTKHPDNWTVYDEEFIGIVSEVNPDLVVLFEPGVQYPLVIIIIVSVGIFAWQLRTKENIEVRKLECKRCGYSWHPRIIDGKAKIPATCPEKKCRSPYWKTPRKTDK